MNSYHNDIMVLQAWFSPAFPTGAFSYSHGLEAAIQHGLVSDKDSLTRWISCLLTSGSGWNDGLFLKAAYEGISDVNSLCLALCSSKERYQETIELGKSFSRAVNGSYGAELAQGLAYPIAVGMAARRRNIDIKLTTQSYLQAFAASLISVGVRIIPIGQQAGQDCLVTLCRIIEQVNNRLDVAGLEQLGSASFMSEIMSMMHEKSNPRIYRT